MTGEELNENVADVERTGKVPLVVTRLFADLLFTGNRGAERLTKPKRNSESESS